MLRRSNKELGQTTLMITHNTEAAGIADRILQVRDGMILSDTLTANSAALPGHPPVVPAPIAGDGASI
jgi:putative ABC transport system ATP-binding protein